MVGRSELENDGEPRPVIAYDAFIAADLFLDTGRTKAEVLPRLGLTPPEWAKLREAYRWFPSHLGRDGLRAYFAGLDDGAILQRVLPPRWRTPDGSPDLRTTWRVREAVRRDPYVGPFADCGWPMQFIAEDPVASLCSYTHDGATVFFKGAALADRQGAPLAVHADSFAPLGGRWLADRDRIYGQGERGRSAQPYWYEVKGADRNSFQPLNLRYARDCAQAYYITGLTLRTRSPGAFEVTPEVRLNFTSGLREPIYEESVTARDREAVYFYGARLRGAKPERFRWLGAGYATDGAQVWWLEGKLLLPGADTATFIVPGPGEPSVTGRFSVSAATDRLRPYDASGPRDPAEVMEDWRPFFEARPDLAGWWWHALA